MKKSILLSLCAAFTIGANAQVTSEADPYERCVVIEEFTSENCPNCPPVARFLENTLEDPDFEDNVIAVTHHSGYYDDWLTNDADLSYTWFYVDPYTYAPAMMFDRYPFFNTDSGYETPVGFVGSEKDLQKYVKKRMKTKSHLALTLTGEYDNNSTIKVHVSGERNKIFSETPERITVFLQEDDIKAHNQANGGANYRHNHVLRAWNEVWGDLVEWNGDKFEYDCTFTIDPEWKKENLKVTAFVAGLDPDDQACCTIENARMITFSTILGIEDAQMSKEIAGTEYFTLDGMKTDAKESGIYIQKKTYKDGSKEIKKISRK